MIRVLIADDHEVVREGLKLILETEADFEVVGEAADGAAAVEITEQLQPDVVLMDLRMPGMDGLQAIEKIHSCWPNIAVVILTTYNEDHLMISGLRAGARGFLLKDTGRQTLFDSLRAAARGEALFLPEVIARVLSQPPVEKRSAGSLLTARELEILRAAARGERSKEIAARLAVAVLSRKRSAVADDEVGRFRDEGPERADAVGREQVRDVVPHAAVESAFSGGYGHEHQDNLSLLLWANGRETFSDLGYTHTKDRAWTICSASHNTVLIDQRNQQAGAGTDGNGRKGIAAHLPGNIDSASSTELYAILSALSGTPIKQGIAVTGSVNQYGDVQPIGNGTVMIAYSAVSLNRPAKVR